jgi:hypothetical protein
MGQASWYTLRSGKNFAISSGYELDATVPAVARIPTLPDFEIAPITSVVGRITPSTRLPGAILSRSFCCIVLKAFAEAVLHARITSGQPCSKNHFTHSRV